MASNIPLGTYVSDGVRTGPLYTGQLPQGFVSDNNGVITSSSHDSFGPGVLLSSQNTWNITPAAPAGVGFTHLNNLVAPIGAVMARDLPLRGDNSVTYLNNGVVQFDWPRIVTVTVTGASVTDNTRITVFGTDWYGFPLQQTYVFTAPNNNVIGTYPNIDIPNHRVVFPDLTPFPAKAFYTVNRVYINAALPALLTQISLGCADAFGLPYLSDGFGSVTSISWARETEFVTTPLNDPIGEAGIYVRGDTTNPSTATTGDVRGFYVPSTPADDDQSLIFTYYVRGADTWINQTANRQQLYMQQTGSAAPQGVPVAPLTIDDLVGVPQFYTGRQS